MPSKNSDNSHLDVYLDRYELHQNDVVTTYYEGFQNAATQQRYAKYGKSYLRDELEELRDKILTSPGVKVAGFIVDSEVDRRRDVINRAEEISLETGVEIELFSFDEWVAYQTKRIAKSELDKVAARWLLAVVESFAQRRLDIAPIDEPCEAWVSDLIKKLK